MTITLPRATVKVAAFVFAVSVMLLTPDSLMSAPNVDGRFDLTEGYSQNYSVNFTVENVGPIAATGNLSVHVDGDGDVYVAFTQPKTLVDNTYGANSIGWGSSAPSGKNHNFSDLLGSDKAQFIFKNDQGSTVLDVTLDYLYETAKGSGVYDAGLAAGGEKYDGKVETGSASSVLAASSSLDYNFNLAAGGNPATGYVLKTDSPATDANYTPNASFPGWVFDVTYETKIDGDIFGAGGFDISQLSLGVIHDSPNKMGKNKVWIEIGDPTPTTGPIPEPLTMLGVLAGTAGIGSYLRRRASAAKS